MTAHPPHRDSVDVEAARIAVLVLSTSVARPGDWDQQHVVIKPSNRVVLVSEAVDTLAGMPKPLACVAEIERGRLNIDCQSLVGGQGSRLHALAVKMFAGPYGLGNAIMRSSGGDGTVQVMTARDSVLVTGLDFERWYQDYALPRTVGLGGRLPTAEESAQGVSYIVTVGRSEEMPVDTTIASDTL